MADKIKDILNRLDRDDPLYEKIKEQDRQRSLYGDSIKDEIRKIINAANDSDRLSKPIDYDDDNYTDQRRHGQYIVDWVYDLVNACVNLALLTNEKHIDAFSDPEFHL